MRKEQKERVVTELAERLRATDTLFVADYRGLSVAEIDGVRTELLEHGARFSVVKNTLTRRAAEEAGVPELASLVDGPTAIAFVVDGDMVAVARTLSETARRTRVLELKGGILQGQPMTAEQVRDLGSLPPVDTLRGEVLAAIVAPLNAIAGLVNAPLQNLAGLIDARIEQLGGEAEAVAPEPGLAPPAAGDQAQSLESASDRDGPTPVPSDESREERRDSSETTQEEEE